ncbi:MAG: hypothetical protein ACYS8Z_22140 [Planctomycetota bacterium]
MALRSSEGLCYNRAVAYRVLHLTGLQDGHTYRVDAVGKPVAGAALQRYRIHRPRRPGRKLHSDLDGGPAVKTSEMAR